MIDTAALLKLEHPLDEYHMVWLRKTGLGYEVRTRRRYDDVVETLATFDDVDQAAAARKAYLILLAAARRMAA